MSRLQLWAWFRLEEERDDLGMRCRYWTAMRLIARRDVSERKQSCSEYFSSRRRTKPPTCVKAERHAHTETERERENFWKGKEDELCCCLLAEGRNTFQAVFLQRWGVTRYKYFVAVLHFTVDFSGGLYYFTFLVTFVCFKAFKRFHSCSKWVTYYWSITFNILFFIIIIIV